MRELRSVGKTITVDIEIHESIKYSMDSIVSKVQRYENVTEWEIVSAKDAEMLEKETDGSCIDDLHEYLVLHFEDGNTATFRNSYVDMFRVR